MLSRSVIAGGRDRRRLALGALLLAALLLLAGCGSARPARDQPVSVALDFTPNPAHAPIYLAARDGYDRRLGVRIQIRVPGSGPDSLQLLLAGKVDIGVLDINDLGLARERGADLVGVGALVQQPLGAIIARPGITSPRDLEGKTVGVSGLPSDPAFLRAILSRDGASLSRVHLVTIGFNAVADMLAGRIDAVPAFWSDEGVTLRQRGLDVREFRIDQYGAPRFPEVVLAVTTRTLRERRRAIVDALAAIALGAERAHSDPAQAAAVIAQADSSGDAKLIRAQTLALRPALVPPLRLDAKVLQQWADFSARTNLLPRSLSVSRTFDPAIADDALRLAARHTT